MDNYKVGDNLVLHSCNGHDYFIEVVNINFYRPPEMVYAVDIYDDDGASLY